jgi:hypothetical protein
MKAIKSNGGPLIGLDRDHMRLWTGIDGKGFIGDDAPFSNDYEAGCDLLGGPRYCPRSISKIAGVAAEGLLISMPLQTAVVPLDRDAIYIAQVEYADTEWDFHMVGPSDYDRAVFDPMQNVSFSCKACTYVFFDAAYAGDEIVDDCITFDLDAGQYVFSTSLYNQNKRTGLILCKITSL